MRVSSLSNPRVIELISKYFVPAWFSRDFYQIPGDHQDEKKEMLRIDRERAKRRMDGGNVAVYILAPDGKLMASQRVQTACKPENLIPFLEKAIADQKLKPRNEDAVRDTTAKAASLKPKNEGGRIFHIWTRLDTGVERGLSNDRVELSAKQCKAFLPPADAKVGATWTIPEEINQKLYKYCYPPGPQWIEVLSEVMKGKMKATLASLSEDEARITLQGEMELKFPVGKPTEGRITAHFVGAAHVDRKKQTLTSFELVSTKADYVWNWQGKPQPRTMRIALELEP